MHAVQCRFFAPILWIVFSISANPVSLLSKSREGNCLSLIPEAYDRLTPPENEGKPVDVFTQIQVLDLDDINEESMDFRLHFYMQSAWKDPRFSLNSTNLHEDCVKHIWTPDLMFEEAKLIIETGQHNVYFVVRDGYFYLSLRYSFKVACMMNFHRYPFDTQHCVFSIAFMATDDSAAILKWFDDEQSPYRHTEPPIVIFKTIDPLQFIIEPPTTHSVIKTYTFGNFTNLLANFTLARRLTGNIVNYYMPSALLVVVSWLTFWLEQDAAPERVTLIMTALLTICTQGDQYKSELPPVNYITAMDIWFFVCLSMLFATLLEFAFSYNAYRKLSKEESIKVTNVVPSSGYLETSQRHISILMPQDLKDTDEANSNSKKTLEKIVHFVNTAKLDSICKILFPGFFLTFNVIYWTYYYQFMPSVF